jgi:glycosyltransferase involved in cell wall biosynthesis
VILLANSLLAGLIEPLRMACGVPVICQVQGEDGFMDELPEEWQGRAESLVRGKLQGASKIVAPCASHANEMAERLDHSIDRFTVVPPCVRPPATQAKRTMGSVVRIRHLSSIRRAKGLDLLVDALADLKDQPFDVCVGGKVLEPSYFAELKKRAQSLGVAFSFGGELATSEKAEFLAGCDFMVLPSRLKESRGIVALEALSHGTPIIAPARGIFPELAEVTGGVAVYSSDADLGDTIRRCLKDREEWVRRGAEAARAVAEHYSPRKSAAAAEACFTSAAGL